jgi:ATP-dependent protease ClpP protease subunit
MNPELVQRRVERIRFQAGALADRDYIMGPEQVVEYGMIDRAIDSRKLTPVPTK